MIDSGRRRDPAGSQSESAGFTASVSAVTSAPVAPLLVSELFCVGYEPGSECMLSVTL